MTAADAPAVAGWVVKDAPLFAGSVVRYAGEPIAAVAAETPAQARAAAAAIELELEPLPASVTLDEALEAGGALVHPDWESYELAVPVSGLRKGNVAWETTTHHGDLDAAFEREDVVVVEDEFRVPRQNQAYIEPRARSPATRRAGTCCGRRRSGPTRFATRSPPTSVCVPRTSGSWSRRSAAASAARSTPTSTRSRRCSRA